MTLNKIQIQIELFHRKQYKSSNKIITQTYFRKYRWRTRACSPYESQYKLNAMTNAFYTKLSLSRTRGAGEISKAFGRSQCHSHNRRCRLSSRTSCQQTHNTLLIIKITLKLGKTERVKQDGNVIKCKDKQLHEQL